MCEVDFWEDLQSTLYLRTVKVPTFSVFLSFPCILISLLELYTEYSNIIKGMNDGPYQGGGVGVNRFIKPLYIFNEIQYSHSFLSIVRYCGLFPVHTGIYFNILMNIYATMQL